MPSLSEVDRHRALGLLQAGLPIREVSLRMNVNRTTIFRLRQRLHETDTVSDRSCSGRPRCTTQRQDRNLVKNHMNDRFLSASASSRQTRGRNNQRISANTVRRRLSTSGLRALRPYIGPILTQRHRHHGEPVLFYWFPKRCQGSHSLREIYAIMDIAFYVSGSTAHRDSLPSEQYGAVYCALSS
ncbi:transposable element Tc1 transposase [Elysia marginata]|uniref:Transposable element Tc1 transposase n=1 Tax=Elysia marginata TaxID=1093978 RepID=A0AAV4FZ76_9GAST|nr:transposable element Tc1 transposase [Elysia marginata]